MNRLLAYAQLLRLPNVFTAFGDILMAACAAGYITQRLDLVVLLLASSGCLYLSGMVFNDIFDRKSDAETQAFRPLPSGRVSLRIAVILAVTLMLVGLVAAWFTTGFFIALGLAAAILAYDAVLKHSNVGPVAMGFCRLLNVLLGLSGDFDAVPHALQLHLVMTIGIYIMGVTLFAKTEERVSSKENLYVAAGAMVAACVMAITMPSLRHVPETWIGFPYLVVAFGAIVAFKVIPAIRQPTPKNVQAAVKRSILSLVVLDAVLASAFVGPPGLLIILLLLPARVLGQWVYST